MKHRISKIKIKLGRDANRMLMKKLVRNFVANGSMETSQTKGKYIKARIDSLVHRALNYSQAAKNVLLPYFNTEKDVLAFVEIAKSRANKDSGSGSVKVLKLGNRFGDAAPIVKVVWSKAVVEEEKKVSKKTKAKKVDKEEEKVQVETK